MTKKTPYCVRRYRAELVEPYGHRGNPRALKRFFRKSGMECPVYRAHTEGEAAAVYASSKANRYPEGARHDAYEDGYKNADPLGDFHGRNV